MHLASDHIHPTPHKGRCRVRIYEPEDRERDSFVVILTELPDNPGMSITTAAEQIAASVVLANALLMSRTVWIEHYEDGARGTPEDPATFDLVTFESYEVRGLEQFAKGLNPSQAVSDLKQEFDCNGHNISPYSTNQKPWHGLNSDLIDIFNYEPVVFKECTYLSVTLHGR